jgi:hypothetical protein
MWGEDESKRLYPAPRNSISEPHGKKRGYNGQGRLVLVRLDWPSGPVIVPARLEWVDDGAMLVAWEKRGVSRRTWLRSVDVATWIDVAQWIAGVHGVEREAVRW